MTKIPCEVYSRVVGFFRPLNHWNPGKQSEYEDRKNYVIDEKELEDGKNYYNE